MLLRYKADIRSLAYMVVTTALFFLQWNLTSVNPFLYFLSLFMAVAVAVMAHNHNHLPMWKNKPLNIATDYWLTLFYGFPAFAWIPTHNKNHHSLNNREGDYTITYRYSEGNNMLTLLTYPSISSFFQQKPIRDYLKDLWRTDRQGFWEAALQYVALGLLYIAGFYLDWKKALLFIAIPHQISLYSVLIFNYVQHVHADEESAYNHSRNFVGPLLNIMLFNNGYHTIHHERAGIHWSQTPESHRKIAGQIDPVLLEKSFWGYMFRVYVFGMFSRRFRTVSKRLQRMARTAQPQQPPVELAQSVQPMQTV